jgi:N-acetylglucosaminyl-diphospho-decaprenol L-rhamnosyltransferase
MLSIIILNFKNPPLLRFCLQSLSDNLGKKIAHEVIVVDSSASIETRNVAIEEFENVKYLPFKNNIGYTKGMNEGIKNSSGKYIFIMNPDVVPTKDSVESLMHYMKENSDIGLIGPQLLNFDGTVQNSCFKFYNPMTIIYRRTLLGYLPWAKKTLDKFLLQDLDLSQPTEVDWIMGSAAMTTRQAVEKVGLMDEKLFLYFSDVDWSRRFWENDYRVIYYPSSKMYHYHRRGSKGRFNIFDALFKKESRWHITDAIKYFRKYGTRY